MYALIVLLASVCAVCAAQMRSGDLIFEIATDSGMSSAIADVTAAADSLRFSHVGIVEVDSAGNVAVIEAAPRHGVVVTPLDTFLNNAANGAVVMRLDADYPVGECLRRAHGYVGREYDWWYLPDNEEIYCSELVEKSYLCDDGTPIFPTIPMSFRDRNGEMPQFWTDLFARLGRPVPEGLPGTNPTQLSRSGRLTVVCRFSHN